MLSIRTKYDGLWLGAGMTGEESGQARLQVTLHAAQEEAFSIGHKVGYHTHHTTGTITSIYACPRSADAPAVFQICGRDWLSF